MSSILKTSLAIIFATMLMLLGGCQSSSTTENATEQIQEETFPVTLTVNFSSNWFFSRYDVAILIDGNSQGTLAHGEDGEFQLQLTEGDHTFRAENSEDSSVSGEGTFNVPSDEKVGFLIDCESSRVYVERMETVTAPISSNDAPGRTSDYLESQFKEAGFNNIRIEELRDLAKDEEINLHSVENVTINGESDFAEGDVFFPDDEVIITHHLPDDAIVPMSAADMLGQNYEYVEAQLLEAGFMMVESKPASYYHSEYGDNEIVEVSFDGSSDFESGAAFPYDLTPHIYYNEPKEDSEAWYEVAVDAQRDFARYGENQFPYGFKCHWLTNTIASEPQGDGRYFLKVGVTITDAYGNKIETVAEGIAGNGTVEGFYVNL